MRLLGFCPTGDVERQVYYQGDYLDFIGRRYVSYWKTLCLVVTIVA